ncbi:sugar/pyridoxal phosphate phosphatase YigL [Blochmannia endosymbiont of Camponotus sp. C-003]|uniref:sugar/pyridoxal phosphate phosphatase YigL n=1 Tax=unclassified Candidatus Blochmanniella TaxID=711328 RepID=UPI0020257720|nr:MULTISPECIES: sugar/pyridoxal phosphate phosphatase YigL [unclassified Candidatus Blochmannia]URJ23274.1 sugar/pyridoxal phosphate phosphatase YigL [Blochmannia endosymbiont of Camponotus sp. C-003]URJ28744.1 sugar/pyridoxal phosphate phosphatase YigL [Blochmannia endosymbiont of Camponotus sp. C-046]
MFRVVVSDLDGTLLTPDHRLTSFTKKILKLLTARNIHFVFATGRHHTNVMQIRDNLKINSYMITSNGAKIHNANGKLIASYDLPTEITADLLRIVHHDSQIITNIFYNDKWLINRSKPHQSCFYNGYASDYHIYQKDTSPLHGIYKVYFTSNNYKRLLSLEKKLHARWNHRINISFSLPTCLEVMPEGVSKGQALEKVVKLLGYQLKDCISFGDGMNDREMLEMTGKGCIMSNAQQRLKDALPSLEIIGSNKDDAVPHYLQYIYCQ